MRTSVPITIKVHYPVTKAGKQKLMGCVAAVHADFVYSKIQKLNCTVEEKKKLTNAVIQTVSEEHTHNG